MKELKQHLYTLNSVEDKHLSLMTLHVNTEVYIEYKFYKKYSLQPTFIIIVQFCCERILIFKIKLTEKEIAKYKNHI